MQISIYETTEKQDLILKSQLDYIALKDEDLENIVTILYLNINAPMHDVEVIVANSGYELIIDDLDTITLWLSRHTHIPL